MSPALLWLIVGLLFVFFEIFVPGFVLAFFGGGALIVALTTWLGWTLGLTSQVIVFLMSSLVLLFSLRRFFTRIFSGREDTEGDTINFKVEKGAVVTVLETIDPSKGKGRVRYQGSEWKATASSVIPAGDSARVSGMNNLTIEVEKV